MSAVVDKSEDLGAVQARLWASIDLVTPMAIRAAATLRLADHVAAGVVALPDLAVVTQTNQAALRRLIRLLAAERIIVWDQNGQLALGLAGQFLLSAHPSQLRLWLDLEAAGGRMDRTVAELLAAIRTGQPVHERVHGLPFWDDLAAHPHIEQTFHQLMDAQMSVVIDDVIQGYAWADCLSVVDVGGGTGVLAAALASAYAQLRITIVETPAACAAAADKLRTLGLAERCDIVCGSFFDALPPDRDVYALSSVLHDWDDEDAVRILCRCRDAMSQCGRVLVIGEIADLGERSGRVAGMDLRMLALLGGKERSRDDLVNLADAAGLALTRAWLGPTGTSMAELRRA